MRKIIFMGTPDYACEILSSLIDSGVCEVVAVYTQPDKPVGRKAILTPPPVKLLAQKHNIDIYQPIKLRDAAVVDELLSIECDMIVVAAYGQILPKEIIDYAPCVNLHASILPQYRGASPIQQSLLNSDKKSGITAMHMDEGLDSGAIIEIAELDIADDEMIGSLYDRLTTLACDLTIKVVRDWDLTSSIAQDESLVTHCVKIKKSDGEIDFSDARDIYNRYRAFTPWPGIYLENALKIKELELFDESSSGVAGEIISIDDNSIRVQCKKGSLTIHRVQAPSKQEVSIIDYLRGKRLAVADILA